jgi:hypothetical protein
MPRHPPENSLFNCAADVFIIIWGAFQMYRNYKRWNDVIRYTWYSNVEVFGKKYEFTGRAYFWVGFIVAMMGLWDLVFLCGRSPLSHYGPP